MALLQVHNNENEIILNTPNRNEILKDGPPQNSGCNVLGRGAYGTVFKAIFRAKQVAVKIVKNLKDVNVESMRNEGNILGWKHRNIVKIFKIESTPNFGIVIMERFSGQCLQLVLDTIALPLVHRVYISCDILSALSYCHRRGLLHLDVKPQNVLVSYGKRPSSSHWHKQSRSAMLQTRRNYVCKLCDFGSSMKFCDQRENTAKGRAKGTVRYMSPEALREEPLTPAADIYSLGITMWQLVHRCLPYAAIECNEIVAYQVVKSNLRPESQAALVQRFNGYGDSDSDILLDQDAHRSCFCQNVASQLTVHSLEHIKNLLNCAAKSQEDAQLHSTASLARNTRTTASSAEQRRPFHELGTRSNTSDAVRRDLRSEIDLTQSVGGHFVVAAAATAAAAAEVEDVNLADIFLKASCVQQKIARKERYYEAIFQSCWHSDFSARPCSEQLRRRLEQLL